MKINVADYIIDLSKVFPVMPNKFKSFIPTENSVDYKHEIDDRLIDDLIDGTPSVSKKNYFKYIELLRNLSEWLPLHNAFVLHSACFDVGGVGVAFAAHSGTDKS